MIAVICLLISCAIIVPWYFPQVSNDYRIGWLTLSYKVGEETFLNESSIDFVELTHNLTYVASRNNMLIVLRTQSYYGYPIAMDVSSWELHDNVDLGTEMAEVVDDSSVRNHECWTCRIDLNRSVFYDRTTGILVQALWDRFDSVPLGIQHSMTVVYLAGMNHDVPGEGYPSQEGIILAGIFIELAIVVWLVPSHLKNKSHQP